MTTEPSDLDAARKFLSEWPRHSFADYIEPALAEAFARYRLWLECTCGGDLDQPIDHHDISCPTTLGNCPLPKTPPPNPMGELLCPPEIAEAVKQSLAAWNALPDDERNGERPFIMGWNDGYETAQAHRADELTRLRTQVDALAEALEKIAKADFLDFSLCPERSAVPIARQALSTYRKTNDGPA